jgi:predicted dehydrogenase
MSNPERALLIGAGGWSREHWIDVVLPDFKDKIKIVGLVDVKRSILEDSGKKLNLSSDLLFTNPRQAFEKVKADFCIVVVPPSAHRSIYELAADKKMHILSEKPISDNLDDVIKTYKLVERSKIKMAITQNYRYEAPILTLKSILESGRLGKIDYIVSRYASDYRKPGSWDVGSVYEMENPLLFEGSIHHFDMIRNLSKSNCKTITGNTWNPDWSSFKSNSNALFMLEMENGVKAVYEGSSNAAGFINRWHQEYYRVECEKGSIVVDRGDRAVRIYTRGEDGTPKIEEVITLPALKTGHHYILSKFLDWLKGGTAPETNLEDNVNSALIVFAAAEAGRTGKPQSIKGYRSKLGTQLLY